MMISVIKTKNYIQKTYYLIFNCFGFSVTVFQRRTPFKFLEKTRDIVIVFESCVCCDVCQWAIGLPDDQLGNSEYTDI